jgi:hypothetical protein
LHGLLELGLSLGIGVCQSGDGRSVRGICLCHRCGKFSELALFLCDAFLQLLHLILKALDFSLQGFSIGRGLGRRGFLRGLSWG